MIMPFDDLVADHIKENPDCPLGVIYREEKSLERLFRQLMVRSKENPEFAEFIRHCSKDGFAGIAAFYSEGADQIKALVEEYGKDATFDMIRSGNLPPKKGEKPRRPEWADRVLADARRKLKAKAK